MTVSWFDGVTLTVEIAFTTDPLDAVPSWTDVSADVRGLSTSSGRSSEFSAFSPSTLSITLSNRTRQYDPEYASSPYVGNLLPMKKIRVRATYSATTYDLFTGYIQGWPQQYDFHFDSTVTVQAVDGSRFLEQATLPTSVYAQGVLDQSGVLAYYKLQGNMLDAGPYGIDGYLDGHAVGDTISYDTTTMPHPLGEAQSLAADGAVTSNIPAADVGEPRGVSFWIYGSSLGSVSYAGTTTESALLVSFDADGGLFVEYSHDTDNRRLVTFGGYPLGDIVTPGVVTHVVVTFDSTNCYAYINGRLIVTETLTVGSTVLDGSALKTYVEASAPGGVSHVAFTSATVSASTASELYYFGSIAYGHPYGERSGARIARILDDAGWPAADRDLSTGDTVHNWYRPNGESGMTAIRDVERAEDGYAFIDSSGSFVLRDRNWQWTQAATTFSDDGSDTPYDAITIDANTVDAIRSRVAVTYNFGEGNVFEEDATSLGAYGPASEDLSTPTIGTFVTARNLSAYKLRTMKDPRTRITQINVKPRAKPATAFPALLNLELGDRASVEITPMNLGSQVVKGVTVQGIAHNITVDGTWDTTLYCSPAPDLATDVPYLIVGDATYGRIGAAAGNAIPY